MVDVSGNVKKRERRDSNNNNNNDNYSNGGIGWNNGSINNRSMTPQEQEAFKRGVMLAFVTTTVQEAVKQSFQRYPYLKGIDTQPHVVASKIIMNTFKRLNRPIPTMEEAAMNVEIIKDVGKELLAMTMSEMGYNTNPNSNNNTDKYTYNNKKRKKLQFTEEEKKKLR